MTPELWVLTALSSLTVAAPVVAVVVYFERRMARVEAKVDATTKAFDELKSSILGML